MRGLRRHQRSLVLLVLLVAVAMTLALAACAPTSPSDGDDPAGYVSDDGSVTLWADAERGEPVVLGGADYTGVAVDVATWRGDVVVLNTWFAACPPCRAEAPDLAAVAGDYAADGVHVLGINFTDDVGTAQAFERAFELPYPSVHDVDGSAVAALQGTVPLQAVPTTVLLDRQGRVAARVLGTVDGTTLRALVDELLAEQA